MCLRAMYKCVNIYVCACVFVRVVKVDIDVSCRCFCFMYLSNVFVTCFSLSECLVGIVLVVFVLSAVPCCSLS